MENVRSQEKMPDARQAGVALDYSGPQPRAEHAVVLIAGQHVLLGRDNKTGESARV